MTYGNDHECTITALKNMEFDVQFFDVEGHWQCAYDWLEVGGTRYCGDSTTPHGIRVSEGEQFTWNTDYSVTRDGWEICMRDFVWAPKDTHNRWCVEANRDDFTLADSSHPGWALHDAAGYGYRWCGVTVDECKELSEGIDCVIGFYMTSNGCCFPMKNECSGTGCPGHGCGGADSGTYMRTPQFTIDNNGVLMFGNGYVCDDSLSPTGSITEDEARMACFEMGLELISFGVGGESPTIEPNFSMDDLNCPAGADSLDDCTYNT